MRSAVTARHSHIGIARCDLIVDVQLCVPDRKKNHFEKPLVSALLFLLSDLSAQVSPVFSTKTAFQMTLATPDDVNGDVNVKLR